MRNLNFLIFACCLKQLMTVLEIKAVFDAIIFFKSKKENIFIAIILDTFVDISVQILQHWFILESFKLKLL